MASQYIYEDYQVLVEDSAAFLDINHCLGYILDKGEIRIHELLQ